MQETIPKVTDKQSSKKTNRIFGCLQSVKTNFQGKCSSV